MKKLIVLFFILLLIPSAVISAPSISGVSGSGTYTISGTAFGTKTQAAPISQLIDNIEAGTNESLFAAAGWVNDNAGLSTTPNTDSVYSTARAHSGEKSLLFDYTQAPWCQNRFDSGSNGGLSTIYFSAWVYFERLDDVGYSNDVQWKLWRISSSEGYATNDTVTTSSIINDWWVHSDNTWFGSTIGHYNGGEADMTEKLGGVLFYASSTAILVGQWQRIEMVATMSTSPNTNDGTYTIRRIGGFEYSDLSITTHDADDGLWRFLRIGQMYNDNDGDTGDKAKIYYDDIYVDNTQSRIEIGNNADFDLCTHREIQVASSWSSTSAEFTIRRGSFQESDNVYVFVIDSDGVPSDGFLLGSAVYDLPTISGPADFSTTESSVEINGSYTTDPDLPDQAVTVTWTLGGASGFCVAALGVFSCTVPVELGANSIVFEITDSNSGTDTDTTVVTRTAPPSGNVIYTGSMSGGSYR